MFQDALNDAQVIGLYKLGPAYRNQFCFLHEAGHRLAPFERDELYNGRLSESILVTYNPAAVDGNLALESSPANSCSSFVHTPHAQLTNGVKGRVEHFAISAIASRILRILIEHVDSIGSLESELSCDYIYSVTIHNIFEVIQLFQKSRIGRP